MPTQLTQLEKERYLKHLQLPEVGEEGQKRLKAASVLLVGTGGLGSPAGLYLAAAGVGRIGLVDGDRVELSNLQRQVIHSTQKIGMLKVESGGEVLGNLNPTIQIEKIPSRFTEANAAEVASTYDVLLDCTDNIQTRLIINKVCVQQKKPMVHGAVFRYEGQVSVFDAKAGPCYRCLYPQIPDDGVLLNPALHGLLATTPGVVGLIMATETLKMILGIGEPLIGRLLIIDLLSVRFHELHIKKDPNCPECSSVPA